MVRWTRGVSPSAIALAVACSGHVEGGSIRIDAPEPSDVGEVVATGVGEVRDAADGTVDEEAGPREAGSVESETPIDVAASPFGPAVLRRFTERQRYNTFASLAGQEAAALLPIRADSSFNGLAAIAMTELAMSTGEVERAELDASAVAQWVVTDAARLQAVVGCDIETEGCVEGFVARFGRLAWRRPLSTEEVARYEAIADDVVASTGDVVAGLRWTIAALLQSPYFLYRVEIGEPKDGDANRRELDDHELASRLAFAMTDAPPDAELVEASDDGTLRRDFDAHVQRLSRGEAGMQTTTRVVTEHLQLPDSSFGGDGAVDEATRIQRDGRRQTEATVAAMVRDDVDFRSWFTSPETFVTASLAQLYDVDVPEPAGLQAFRFGDDSPRRGLLGHASLLTLHAAGDDASPTLRGRYIREHLLCEAVGAPPPGVEGAASSDAGDSASRREHAATLAGDPNCAGCHTRMDPIGLALERFDGTGRYRASDDGGVIDASGALDEIAVDGALQLGAALSRDARVPRCLVQTAFRRAAGALATAEERAVITEIEREFEASGYRVAHLVRAVVSSPAFASVRALDEEQAL